MSLDKVRNYLKKWNRDQDIIESGVSTATVELAAKAIGVIPARIAKTLSFSGKEGAFLVVTAGDARVDNRKFKEVFSIKPRMLPAEDVMTVTGFNVGGVCPFGIPDTVNIYLDRSLMRFQTVFPACGTDNSAIEITLDALEEYSNSKGWVDVCKNWQQ